MDSRERTFLALNHEAPDRIPIDFWMSKGFELKLESALSVSKKVFLDRHDVDLRYIQGPEYIGPPLRKYEDGSEEDIWGVRRKQVEVPVTGGVEYYSELAESPLALMTDADEINSYKRWPSPDWFDYSGIEAQCRKIREQGKVAVFVGDRLNRIAQLKPAMYLRGVEQILIDLAMNPEIAAAILSIVREFYCEYAGRIFHAANGKLDILLMGDDFGSQNGPLVSPEMWVDFFGNGFAEYIDLAKNHGLRVMHHTCGGVKPIIPLMIERGLDVLQSLQPEAANMGPLELKNEFGDRLAFHGGISIQKTLPFGTPEDVREEVRNVADALSLGGGYIFCTSHNIQADTPIENVEELLKAYRDYG